MRLWELEGGDGDDVGIGYAGGVRPVEIPPDPEEREVEAAVAADIVVNQPMDIPEIVEPDEEEEIREERPEIQREGPLVLRINQPLPPAAPAVPDPPPAVGGPQRPHRQQAQRRGNPRGGHWGAAQRREPNARQQARIAQVQAQGAAEREEANQRWVRMFVQMAMNDEEDELDSDDEDPAAWEIPVR